MIGTKVTFVFEQTGNGFTESHYLETNSTDFSTEFAKAQSLVVSLMNLRGADCIMTYIRLSDLSNPRRYRLEPVNPPATGRTSGKTLPVTVAILTKLRDVNFLSTGRVDIQGLWKPVLDTDGIIDPSSTWVSTYFPNFINKLRNDQWCWKPRDRATQKKSVIATVTVTAGGTLTVTTLNDVFAGPFPSQMPIPAFISGVQGAVLLNGQRIFLATDARTATTVRRIPTFPYVANTGRITVNLPTLIRVNSGIAERTVEKKAGKILYVSAGRRRVLKLA